MAPSVLLVAHEIHDHGGQERTLAELIRRGRHRYDFSVVSAQLGADLRPLVSSWHRIPVPRRPGVVAFPLFWLLAWPVVRREQSDLVQVTGALVPNRADVAAVHFCHAAYQAVERRRKDRDIPPGRSLNIRLYRALAVWAERYCYRPGRVAHFTVDSPGLAAELTNHYDTVTTTVVPIGVDIPKRDVGGDRREVTRRSLGAATATVVLFLGGDWPRKGLDVVIRAMSLAVHAGADLVLWIVGFGGGKEGFYRGLADELGIGARVRFLGRTQETASYYAGADVFVLPSDYETYSLPAHEAAAAGLAIVVTPVYGVSNLIVDGLSGLVVQQRAEAVAEAFVQLHESPALRHQLGGEAQRRAASQPWDESVSAILDVYDALLAPRGRPTVATSNRPVSTEDHDGAIR